MQTLRFRPEAEGRGVADPRKVWTGTILVVVGRMEVKVGVSICKLRHVLFGSDKTELQGTTGQSSQLTFGNICRNVQIG
ncbi:hypothetical protein DPX16_23151 [Anabarilius grahami]|uniref:Uncharacterized protein n=1 Tax=Anabarilius grahami TaxID=495550 RepID=A0A3N0XHS5_ANAGA|nr:hypothetical protein DPX16_23151 [Anabarilius grahami]